MRCFLCICKTIKNSLSSIHTVDKCLCLFMLVLLLQSAYSLFVSAGVDTANIDVIVRTSAASIFGYFLSVNFIRRTDKSSTKDAPLVAAEEKKQNLPDAVTPEAPPYYHTANTIQIVIATCIGLFCLIVLLIFKNFYPKDIISSNSILATVTQFRDFVSGCIGFLIGCPTHTKN